jgi:hypothetical protein
MKANYLIKVGETLRLQLNRVEGDLTIVDTIAAKLKRAGPNGSIPASTAPTIAMFTVINTAEGWDLLLEDEQTTLLEPGIYVADAKLNLVDGGVMKTDSVLIDVRPSVT